ncbi:MAG: cyclophilin-like family protein [Halococcoides sp.]
MADLTVTVADRTLDADWLADNPALRDALATACPVAGEATRWGDELYFGAPLDADPETTTQTVDPGTIAYWPAGEAICLFWGPTPASTDDEPRAAGPVAPLARIGDHTPLDAIDGDAAVRIATD